MKSTFAVWLVLGIGAGGLIWLNDRHTPSSTAQADDQPSARQPDDRANSTPATPVPAPSSEREGKTSSTKIAKRDVEPGKSAPAGNTTPKEPEPQEDNQEDNTGGYFGRVLGEHFSSHPSTQRRILHLRSLSQNPGGKKPAAKPKEGIDLLIDVKNRLARASSEALSEVAGPLSLKDEWAIGTKVHDQLVESVEVDEQESQRIQALIEPLLAQLKRTKDMPYRITVIKDKTVNAFAHLGGHVYVYTGLLELFENDQQLMFVLGHEIGHIELEQCAKASLPGITAERIVGSVGKLPVDLMHKLVQLSYSEENELDADVWSYRRLKVLNYSDEHIFAFFKVMLNYEQEQKSKATEPKDSQPEEPKPKISSKSSVARS